MADLDPFDSYTGLQNILAQRLKQAGQVRLNNDDNEMRNLMDRKKAEEAIGLSRVNGEETRSNTVLQGKNTVTNTLAQLGVLSGDTASGLNIPPAVAKALATEMSRGRVSTANQAQAGAVGTIAEKTGVASKVHSGDTFMDNIWGDRPLETVQYSGGGGSGGGGSAPKSEVDVNVNTELGNTGRVLEERTRNQVMPPQDPNAKGWAEDEKVRTLTESGTSSGQKVGTGSKNTVDSVLFNQRSMEYITKFGMPKTLADQQKQFEYVYQGLLNGQPQNAFPMPQGAQPAFPTRPTPQRTIHP